MASSWPEVKQALEGKRCELVLSGAAISERISKEGLDKYVFKVTTLNFLEISKTILEVIPDEIGELSNLARLVLANNKIQSIPSSIGRLKKLKFLDVSFNSISVLPKEIEEFTDLQSLNVSNNKLSAVIPDFSNLVNLVSLNISFNQFTEVPDTLCQSSLTHFSELIANNNSISSLSSQIKQLVALKTLNLSDNCLSEIPGELGDCNKLKELNLKCNKLKDKRLAKLIDQCHTKQVLEYVRSHCRKENSEESKMGKSKKKTKQNKKGAENEEVLQLLDQITVLHVQDDVIKVICKARAQDIRPYIVCCIINDVDFQKNNTLKKFIIMQTKLHETVCEKRQAATIATHDLSKIKGNLFYDAEEPDKFKILPLNRKKELTAAELYAQLNEEADAVRKEKKKNTYSGIHKYLYLLKDKPLYPCLTDESEQVISFPPITNSDLTKVSEETKRVFVEVTGSSLPTCKKVLDTLLEETLKLDISKSEPEGEDGDVGASVCHLSVQQVKVVDEEGKLKVVYPSRTDIQSVKINVIRA